MYAEKTAYFISMLVLQMCKIAAYRAELLLLGIGSVLSDSGFQSMNRTSNSEYNWVCTSIISLLFQVSKVIKLMLNNGYIPES